MDKKHATLILRLINRLLAKTDHELSDDEAIAIAELTNKYL